MELFLSTAKPPTAVACALDVLQVKDFKVSQGKLPFTELKWDGDVLRGEYAIARTLFAKMKPEWLGASAQDAHCIQHFMDLAIEMIGAGNTRYYPYFDAIVQKRQFLVGYTCTLADIVLADALMACGLPSSEQYPHLTRYFEMIDAHLQLRAGNAKLQRAAKTAAGGGKPKKQRLQAGGATIASTTSESKTDGKGKKGKKGALPPGVSKDRAMLLPLKDAEVGKVVTRFPPEPSGYLHIGHAKALMLNSEYARIYDGKLLLRFDDTNPSNENEEFEESILHDIKSLDIKPSWISHTSDFFDLIIDYARKLIKDGNGYMDDTAQEEMQKQRMDGIESVRRNATIEENQERFEALLRGDPGSEKWCLRVKLDMKNPNKCLRDPVGFRSNKTPHVRTGTKYKAYPTYDFACPIVDSVEGVTHAMRTSEYRDRLAQYHWIQELLGLRKVEVQEFSRLNFLYTLLSKRKLRWFVEQKKVDGWDDPRFPTVRGMLRRGVTPEGLRNYMLMQGASKRIVDLEWHKFWATNKKVVDPVAPRFVAVNGENCIPLYLQNGPDSVTGVPMPLHPKNESVGTKISYQWKHILLEGDDAQGLVPGEEVTLMRWGNCIITQVNHDDFGKVTELVGKLHLEGDFKSTKKKLTWVPDVEDKVHVTMHEFDSLISKPKLGDEEDFKDFVNSVTEAVTSGVGEPYLRTLSTGTIIQLERRGYFRVETPYGGSAAKPLRLYNVPDGKEKGMSTLSTKIQAKHKQVSFAR